MAFDPDKYLEQKLGTTDKDFDPSSYLKAKSMPISEAESALQGAAQGASFGFAPAISGALQAVPTAINAATGSGSMQDILDAYRKARDASEESSKQAEAANPKSFLAGSLAGGILPAALTGGVSEEASLAKGLSSALPISAKTAAGALTGSAYGALSGLGNSVSQGSDAEDSGKNIAENAIGGSLLGGSLSKLANSLSGAPEALDEIASQRALKATGIGRSDLKQMIKSDVRAKNFATTAGTEAPESSISKTGNLLLEPNSYQESPVVTIGATPDVILERAQDLQQKSGQDIGNILSQLDQTFSKGNPTITDKFVNPSDIASDIQTHLLDPLKVNGNIPPVSSSAADTLQDIIDSVNQYGNTPITFEKAQQLKQLINSLVNYGSDNSSSNQVLKQVSSIINNHIEQAADDVTKDSGMSDLMDKYTQAKNLYNVAKNTVDNISGKVASNMTGNDLGLTDYMAGAVGLAAHGTGTGMLAAAGNKLARTYGNTALASGARATSNILSGLNNALMDAPKETVVNLGQQLINSGGELEKSLGNVLVGAGDRDDIGRNALIFSLMQNSGYRDLLRKYMGGKAPTQ